MKRGEVWTVSGTTDYAGKPRPVVIVQDDNFSETDSLTICLLTSVPSYAPYIRLEIEPTPANGLRQTSRLMTDKIITVPRSKLGKKIGKLTAADMNRISQSIILFLGLAETGASDDTQ